MSFLKSKLQIFTTIVFLGFFVWWLSFQSVVDKQGLSVQWFGGTYGILALIGALVGFTTARKWGGFKTILGKALMFFSLGLFAQEAGQLILTYYIYGSKIQIPYPSWGDVAYFGSTLSYLTGTIFLNKAIGTKFSLRTAKYKLIAAAIPVIILSISFFVFLHHHQYDTSHPLTVILDLGYPIGDALYISFGLVAYLLSRKMLGGVMRSGILILIFALILQYISDFTFLFQSSRGTFIQGKYDDLAYLATYFVTTTAMINFLVTYKRLSGSAPMTTEAEDQSQEGAA